MLASVDCTVRAENIPNRATDQVSTHLRPTKSDSRPPIMAPKNRPKVLIEANRPLVPMKPPQKPAPVVRWNRGASTGMVTPGACRSIPSPSEARQQAATTQAPRLAPALDAIWFPPRSIFLEGSSQTGREGNRNLRETAALTARRFCALLGGNEN